MSADERALLAAVCADPDADLPRLVYADWLDDAGRPDRAEFIRLACGFAAALGDTARTRERGPLLSRAAHLGRTHGDRWRRELPADRLVRWGRFRRGFVAEAAVRFDAGHGRDTPALLDGLFAAAPLQELNLSGQVDDLLAAVGHPRAAQLDRLQLTPGADFWYRADWATDYYDRLATHTWPPRLRDLVLHCYNAVGLARLAAAPPGRPFPELRVCCYADNPARDALRARFGDRVTFHT